jgi:hypothetical protein
MIVIILVSIFDIFTTRVKVNNYVYFGTDVALLNGSFISSKLTFAKPRFHHLHFHNSVSVPPILPHNESVFVSYQSFTII